jgi:hypothetical protein
MVFQDVVDGVKSAADLIDNIAKVAGAIRTGREYLKRQYPDASTDVVDLSNEIAKTLKALASASALVTRFSFTVSGPGVAGEPVRFNDYLIANKVEEKELQSRITDLRGRCLAIRNDADRLDEIAKKKGLRNLWALFGLHPQGRDQELATALSRIYDEEWTIYDVTRRLAIAITESLREVQLALGPPGQQDPARVPQAAAVLGKYAPRFADLEGRCNQASEAVGSIVEELTAA